MDYSILCEKINKVEEVFPNSILHINFGEKKLFVLDLENHPKLDPVLQTHYLIQCKTKNIVNDLVKDFKENLLLRDFFSCNFIEICKKFYKKFDNQKILEIIEPYNKNDDSKLFKIQKFGILKKNAKFDDEEFGDWMTHLGKEFYVGLKRLNQNYDFAKICELLDGLFDIQLNTQSKFEQNTYICVENLVDNPLTQSFFQAWQLHHFYEEYINSIFEEEIGFKSIKNPVIFINPTIDEKGNLRGYIELDGCLYNSNKGAIFIECKNSSLLKKNHLFKFCGQVSILEKIYSQEFNKCLVSTGERVACLKEIEKYPSLNKIKIFDLDSHKSNYSDLKAFAKKFK